MEREPSLPDWRLGDTLRSIIGVVSLGKAAVLAALERFDDENCDLLNEPETTTET